MTIASLRCEYLRNPLGLETARPRLFWQLQTDRAQARQIAYRISVASAPDQLDAPDLWDSGRIESAQTIGVIYDGAPLSSRQSAFWRVEVEDETGALTRSEVASWEMGLLERTDWSAQWIGGILTGGARTPVPAPFLRRTFALDKPVKRARLYATALGVYECYFNGARVGDEELAPGWTDYRQRVQYQTYDVTGALQMGENCWGAVLGDGWYCGQVGWRARQFYGDAPQFLGQLEIEFEDGSRQTYNSDQSWSHAYGPVLDNDLLMGQSFDARLDFPGWNRAGFQTDARWSPVKTFAAPSVANGEIKLSAPLAPPVRATQEIVPLSVERRGAKHIFDLGQNMTGRVRLKISGPRGTTVRLRYAETLEGGPAAQGGGIYIDNLRAARVTDYYTLSGGGEEIWEPRFTFHGFRYVELSDWNEALELDAVTGIVLHSDNPKSGDFECSDALVNQLQKNIEWGWRGNSLDVPTDCPQRDERLGWTGDAQVFARTSAFNFDVAAFWSEWARDVADAQFENGGVPCVVPDVGALNGATPALRDGGPAWADAVLICPYTVYRVYGDTRILEENWSTFERYFEFLESTNEGETRCGDGADYYRGFGDWLALDGSGQTEGGTPKELIGTAFWAHAADLMGRMARALGRDSAHYDRRFEQIRTAFCRRFVSPEGLMSPPYQTPYLLALQFNLVPDELRPNVANELVRAIRARRNHLSTGFVGSPYINHILTETGHLDVAYELLMQKSWPGWLYAVTQGATTIWERWNGWTEETGFADKGMNSFNHYAYGAIGSWLYQVVAGIELDDETPGYARFKLEPRPGADLTWARAHLDTLHGRIESEWHLEDGVFRYRFVVPPNTAATLTLPGGETREIGAGVCEGEVKM